MSIWALLTGGSQIIDKSLSIVDEIVEDKDLKNKLEAKIREMAISHSSTVVTILLAGPKPALMWTAWAGFTMHYVLNPFFHMFGLPILELQVQDLYALAGLGGASIFARSWEKVKDAAGNH